MILIPNWASSGKVWDATVAHYRDKYECHAVTIAGFAGAPPIRLERDKFLSTIRDDLIAYIRDKKLEKPVVVGHSLGGFLALWIAERAPELVGPLVIVDAVPCFGPETGPDAAAANVARRADRMRKEMAAQTPEQTTRGIDAAARAMVSGDANFEKLKAWGRTSDHATIAEALAELHTIDIRPDLPRVHSPVLVMASGRPTSEIAENRFRSQYTGLAGYKFVMFEKARHFIMLDDPEGFLRTMDDSLKE